MSRVIRSGPCQACPYRVDAPAGVWSAADYLKLPGYDAETAQQQPVAVFGCHATPERLCHGWAVVHTNRGHDRDLLALRFAGITEIPEPNGQFFDSGTAAAEHGMSGIDNPSPEARETMARLLRKYKRLSDRGN